VVADGRGLVEVDGERVGDVDRGVRCAGTDDGGCRRREFGGVEVASFVEGCVQIGGRAADGGVGCAGGVEGERVRIDAGVESAGFVELDVDSWCSADEIDS
jgi:hypothetical protein